MFANLDYPSPTPSSWHSSSARRASSLDRARRPRRASPCSAATARSSSRRRCSGSTARLGARRRCYGELLPRACARRRARRRLLALDAERRRPPVPPEPRRRPLLRRRRVPPPARGRAPRRGALRRRVPRVRERARRRGRSTGCVGDVRSRPALEGRGCPRDLGAGWDFDDVRDHYLRAALRRRPGGAALGRPRALPRARARVVTGEVMAAVFGEWRRAGVSLPRRRSSVVRAIWCPGPAGASSITDGQPKAAYHHLRRALAPVAVWMHRRGAGRLRHPRRKRRK